MLAVFLVALSLGLSNFTASVGIGVTGVSARTRLRVGVTFGLFETGMPVLGLLLGHSWQARSAMPRTGSARPCSSPRASMPVIQALRSRGADGNEDQAATASQQTGRLLVTGLALSIDNLAVGFALGAYHVSLLLAAIVIGAVSVALSLIGLELGSRLGAKTGERGELISGLILIGVGVAIAAGTL